MLGKTQVLSDMQRHFSDIVPAFAQSSQVLNLQYGTLTVAAGNAAIAAKLRQLAPELVARLQKRGCEVIGIRVKVQVSFSSGKPVRTPRKLGKDARKAVDELSRQLDEGSPLGRALKRIAGAKD